MSLKEAFTAENFAKYIDERFERRQIVLDAMNEHFSQGKDCSSCQGFCCTSLYNSMQVTPVQALDLFFYLKSEGRMTEALVNELKENIKKYRLDYVINTGRNSSFRRSYTCPFFKPGTKGCTIAPESKPYGCLAFNPGKVGVSEEGHCGSDRSLLERRENPDEDELNEKLRTQLGLAWERESIPVALLNLIELFEYKTEIP